MIDPAEAEKMLGVYLAVDRNNVKQVQVMGSKAESWKEKNRIGQLSSHGAWTALNTTIMKTMEYPLGAITIIRWDLESLF